MKVVKVTNEEKFQAALKIRKIVFVQEQQVPIEEEIDQYDQLNQATHFVMYNDENEPIGAGRYREVEDYGKIERICILPNYRKNGSGKQLMDEIIRYAKETGAKKVKLNAQTQALPFYEKLGFTVTSDEFLDAGIPHKAMEMEL
jgi:predicted GNAT family N-acyltransferase